MENPNRTQRTTRTTQSESEPSSLGGFCQFQQIRDFTSINVYKLEGCIDDERQFKTAKRSQAPVDATVRKRFSRITSLFFVGDRKE